LLFGRLAAAQPPNLVIFYADDLGWGETGFQGNKDIPTPNIDMIARNGVRFTSGYVAATYCSPSRAGLMTGRYPTRFGHEFNSVANLTGLRLDQTTIADRQAGEESRRLGFQPRMPHGAIFIRRHRPAKEPLPVDDSRRGAPGTV
jgi:hypothetical protein